MNFFETLRSGEEIEALVGFLDVERFGLLARHLDGKALARAMEGLAALTQHHVDRAGGRVLKYIGDEALLAFPPDKADIAVASLQTLKAEADSYLAAWGQGNVLTLGLHRGPVIPVKLPPFDNWDFLGSTVNTLYTLDRRSHPGKLIITPQVFRRLEAPGRKPFHKYTPPVVYLA